MRKHTPGPWRYEYEPGFCGELIAANGTIIAEFISEPRPPNARLIAAAPELLEALQGLITGAEAMGWNTKKARAAIAKATGENK